MNARKREQPITQERREATEIARAFVVYTHGLQEHIKNPPLAIVRSIEQLLKTKKIQGIYDQMGDKIINGWVDSKFGDLNNWNIRINRMLRSNYFLSKIFTEMKLPLSANRFLNERLYRFDKREASLVEWFVGMTQAMVQQQSSKIVPPHLIQQSIREMLSNSFFKSVDDKETMERELAYYEHYSSTEN